MLLDPLLPDSTLQVLAVYSDAAGLTLEICAQAPHAACPLCGQPSARVHSRYTRHPQDLPWVGQPLRLRLHVRRFRCLTPTCRRRIFTERLPALLRPSARATQRLEAARHALVLAAGGEGGHSSAPTWVCPLAPTNCCAPCASSPYRSARPRACWG